MNTPTPIRTMRAFRMFDWHDGGRLCEMPVPVPGPGEVRLRVGGNGLCQSDLHALDDLCCSPPHLDVQLPMTLGHEIAGWVDLPGPGVSGWAVGQACAVSIPGCGHCRACIDGWNNYCSSSRRIYGGGFDGGLAEYVVVREDCLVDIGTLEPWRAAPLTDAGLSAYHAVKRVAPLLQPGSSVLVVGVGGLGHIAIATLRAITAAHVIAIDTRVDALGLAVSQGVDRVLDATDLTPELFLKRIGRVDAVLDFVGSGDTLRLAAGVIRPLGHIVVVGRGHGAFELRNGSLPYGAMISTTFGGSKSELIELIALASTGRLPIHLKRHQLDEVPEVLRQMRRGEIVGRAVIVPQETSR
jgi:propanol-preferring alcohol dehydrogenase